MEQGHANRRCGADEQLAGLSDCECNLRHIPAVSMALIAEEANATNGSFGTARRMEMPSGRTRRLTGPHRQSSAGCEARNATLLAHATDASVSRTRPITVFPCPSPPAKAHGNQPDATSITMRKHPRCRMHTGTARQGITAAIGSARQGADLHPDDLQRWE